MGAGETIMNFYSSKENDETTIGFIYLERKKTHEDTRTKKIAQTWEKLHW